MKAKGWKSAAAALVVFAAARPAAAAPVKVEQAISAAIETNLAGKLAAADGEAARARVLQAASSLLPNLMGTASQKRTFEHNLAAEGLSGGPIPEIIGPYDTFDARLRLTQTLFDLSFIKRLQAAGAGRELAARQEEVVREQLASAAALSYVEAQRARQAVAAAQADAALAESLLSLAQDQNNAGVSTGVDVARAKTRAAQTAVRLLSAQVARRNADLRLKRLAGWPLSEEIELADDLKPTPLSPAPLNDALAQAAQARPELAAAREQLRVCDLSLGASRAERAPSLVAGADFGLSGKLPDASARRTGSVGIGLSLPLFTGGMIQGRVDEARSGRERAEAVLADVRAQVEEEVRLAYQNVPEAQEQVAAAAVAEDLARQELRMAEDQYAAGTVDNVAVTSAQTELAQARDAYVSSLARDYDARINLAAAVGGARKFGF